MPDQQPETFSELRSRLDEIVSQVRKKDLSLEKSLDLYEEAIELGNKCAELIDKPDYTEQEAAAAQEVVESAAPDISLSGEMAQAEHDEASAQHAEDSSFEEGASSSDAPVDER